MLEFSLRKNLSAADGPMTLDVQVQIPWGKVVNLYGPSGAGKTSILRMLAGLMHPDDGRISIKDDVWFDSSIGFSKKPKDRHLGFIFQDYALFPNMTVRENLHFALDDNRSSTAVDELIHLIELQSLRDRKPATLSGGQKQRVALARALVRKPDLLLLDEPLSALDHAMRKKLQQYILELHQKYELTTILVSHDTNEIRAMADVIIKLDKGRIVQQGNQQEVDLMQDHTHSGITKGTILSMGEDAIGHFANIANERHQEIIYYQPQAGEILSVGDVVTIARRGVIADIRVGTERNRNPTQVD